MIGELTDLYLDELIARVEDDADDQRSILREIKARRAADLTPQERALLQYAHICVMCGDRSLPQHQATLAVLDRLIAVDRVEAVTP